MSFAFLMGDRNTLATELAGEFASRSRSSYFIPWRTPGVNELGFRQGGGEYPPPTFDLTRTDYLITFGTNLLEEPPSPVYFNRIYGKLKEKRARTGLKMVHVDAPRAARHECDLAFDGEQVLHVALFPSGAGPAGEHGGFGPGACVRDPAGRNIRPGLRKPARAGFPKWER